MYYLNSPRVEKARSRAIARARELHNRVTWLGERLYAVTSKASGKTYVVKFAVFNGRKFAACSCPSGQVDHLCHHVCSAYSAHLMVQGVRWAAEKQRRQTA